LTTAIQRLCAGVAKTSTAQSDLLSGINSVVERIRQDAYSGDFDPVLERHSLTASAVVGQVQQPEFLCQPGTVLRHHDCGMHHITSVSTGAYLNIS